MHWRKTAKVCPKCHKLKPANRFIAELESCSECEFDNEVFKLYKQCLYCRKFKPKDSVPTNVCMECVAIQRDRRHRFKDIPRMKEGVRYICTICNVAKSYYSYARGTDIDCPQCKKCLTDLRLKKEGKFRCCHCGSAFSLEQRGWYKGKGNYQCLRCSEKDNERTKKWLREVYRKRPEVKEWYRQYRRWKYWTIEKPLMNKTLFLQWTHGFAKKRRVNRDAGWYVVNRAMFADFKKRPKYWYAMTQKVIDTIKKGDTALEKVINSSYRPPPPDF